MATTWEIFLSQIRSYLKDNNSTTPKYSDDLILLYTQDAVRDYSQWFPLVKRAEVQNSGGSYPLPADLIDVRAVECPEESYLARRMVRPGRRYKMVHVPTHYWVAADGLYLNSETADPIYLTYASVHDVPAAVGVPFTFTVPTRDMDLLNLYVRAQCLGQTRSRQANLDRFKRTGRRDDNPMLVETNTLMDEYYAKVAERVGGKVIYLNEAK